MRRPAAPEPNPARRNTNLLAVRVDDNLYDRLRREARDSDATISEVVRAAIERHCPE